MDFLEAIRCAIGLASRRGYTTIRVIAMPSAIYAEFGEELYYKSIVEKSGSLIAKMISARNILAKDCVTVDISPQETEEVITATFSW